jgi:hypothetical protein
LALRTMSLSASPDTATSTNPRRADGTWQLIVALSFTSSPRMWSTSSATCPTYSLSPASRGRPRDLTAGGKVRASGAAPVEQPPLRIDLRDRSPLPHPRINSGGCPASRIVVPVGSRVSTNETSCEFERSRLSLSHRRGTSLNHRDAGE